MQQNRSYSDFSVVAAKAAVEIGWMIRRKCYISERGSVKVLICYLNELSAFRGQNDTTLVHATGANLMKDIFRSVDSQLHIIDHTPISVRLIKLGAYLERVREAEIGSLVDPVSVQELAELRRFCIALSAHIERYLDPS